MKFRKSRPSISASIGRMIVLSIPRRPDASPEKKAVAASTHSSAAMRNHLPVGRRILRPGPAPTPSSPTFALAASRSRGA